MTQEPDPRPEKEEDDPWKEYLATEKSDEQNQKGGAGCLFSVAVFLGLTALVVHFGNSRGAFQTSEGKWDMAYAVAMCAFVSALASRVPAYGYGKLVKHASIWIGILVLCLVGYSFRADLNTAKERILGALVPNRGMSLQQGAMSYEVASDGHFYIQARVEGEPIHFLADTGATNIVLTKQDAERIGIDPHELEYSGYASTANGIVRVATVELKSLQVGEFSMHDFRASVNDSELDVSLLGMSFFSRLYSYEVQGDVLTIKWAEPHEL